jgi:hypothetical protein
MLFGVALFVAGLALTMSPMTASIMSAVPPGGPAPDRR